MRSQTFLIAFAGLSAITAQSISQSGRCGAQFGLTCTGSTYGSCCSQYDYCGSTAVYCGEGCQQAYGTCTSSDNNTPSKVSTDGSCGGSQGQTCLNSAFGNCCSQYGYCGSTSGYCGHGCNPAFGTCNDSPSPSATADLPTSTPTQIVTISARCGAGFGGQTCLGSSFGDCCSKHFYCGSTADYCRPDSCQKGYGRCDGEDSSTSFTVTSTSSASSTDSASSSSSTSTAETSETSSATTTETSSSSSSENTSSSETSTVESTTTESSSATSTSTSSSTTSDSSTTTESTTSDASSTATSSTATPALPSPTNFCLKVVTPDHLRFGWSLRAEPPAFVSPRFYAPGNMGAPVLFFDLQPSGWLTTTTGQVVAALSTEGEVSILRHIAPAAVNALRPPLVCSVAEDNTLDCVATKEAQIWKYFHMNDYWLIDQQPGPRGGAVKFRLGIFFGPDCVPSVSWWSVNIGLLVFWLETPFGCHQGDQGRHYRLYIVDVTL